MLGKNLSSVNPFTQIKEKAEMKGSFGSTGNGLFTRDKGEPAVSIFARKVETIGNLMEGRKQVDWSQAKINISKETMDIVEMECTMKPEIVEAFSKLE